MDTMITFAQFIVVFQAAVFVLVPNMTRPGLFFGVTVDPAFASSDAGRRILSMYRRGVVACAVIALMLLNRGVLPAGSGIPIATAIQVAGGMALWIWGHRKARTFAAPVPSARTAMLAPRDARLPGGWLFLAGPIVIVAGAAIFLFANWEMIPERFPVHWGIDGLPDRWEERSVAAVIRPLVISLFTAFWMLFLAYYTMARTRQISLEEAAAARELQFKRFSYIILVLSAYMMAGISAFNATSPLWRDPETQTFPIMPFMAATIAIMAVVLFYAVRYGQGGARGVPGGAGPGDRSPDERWKWGLFYYNPDDPAFLVEKRMGFGWTFNFANAWSWVFIALMVIIGPALMWLMN